MSGIFISYRREDSAPYAGRLYDRLCARFGADRVFMDVDDIPPGADFVAHIKARVASCDAMIVVIGKTWLAARDSNGQLRMADPNDFVLLEVSHGLRRSIPVIPVLVGGAILPAVRDLPEALAALAQREAVRLSDQDFNRDVEKMIAPLAKLPSLGRRSAPKNSERSNLLERRKKALLWKAPLVFVLVAFAIWWQWRQDQPGPSSMPDVSADTVKTIQALAGRWNATITYGWGATHNEEFFFQPENSRLYGTASFLAAKRGLDDGKIAGDEITFNIRFEEQSAQGTRERKNYYGGRVSGDKIHFRLQDDRGSAPVEFTAVKSAQPR